MRWLGGITDSMDASLSHTSTLAWKIPWTEEPGRLLEVFVGGRRETLVSLAFCRGP